MASSANEAERAIAKNFIWDSRVTKERAEQFLDFLESEFGSCPSTPREFRNGLALYRKRLVAPIPPAFEELPASESNLILESHDLVHVCNVTTRLIRMTTDVRTSLGFETAKRRLGHGGAAFSSISQVDAFLGTIVGDSHRTRRFVEAFLAMSSEYQKMSPWNPTWAAVWHQFEPAKVTIAPNSWLEVVGLQAPLEPNWLLLLRYPSSEVQNLYRPTQLEAGDFALHFPSPPCASLDVGGIAMQVGPASPSIWEVMSEFIHIEVPPNISHWEATGSAFGQTSVPTYDSVSTYRRRHLQVLKARFGEQSIYDWTTSRLTAP